VHRLLEESVAHRTADDARLLPIAVEQAENLPDSPSREPRPVGETGQPGHRRAPQ